MGDLVDATEMYLRAVYEMAEDGTVALRARIAERLGQSGPTVSQTVARMERDGLVVVMGDRHLELTDQGWVRATSVMRKHRLAERFLADVIGLEWDLVHAEACRWEHVLGDAVERRIVALLGDPGESPYGNPVPGLGQLAGTDGRPGVPPRSAAADGLETLIDVAHAGGGTVVVHRLGEHLQESPEILRELRAVGVLPGRSLGVGPRTDRAAPVEVRGGPEACALWPAAARAVFVSR